MSVTPADPSARAAGLLGRLGRSSAWSLGGQATSLLASLVATPFILRQLGPVRFGVWSLILASARYVWLAEFGMATASTRFAAMHHSRGDDAGEGRVIVSSLLIAAALTAAAGIALALAAPAITTHLLHLPRRARPETIRALRICAAGTFAAAGVGILVTPQQVRLHWRPVAVLQSGPPILQSVVSAPLLALVGGGVVTMAIVLTATWWLAAALALIAAARILPALRRSRTTRQDLRDAGRYGGTLALIGALTIPLTTADRFFLTHHAGPRVVGYYAVAATLAGSFYILSGTLQQPLVAAITRLEEDPAARRELVRRALRWLATGATVLAVLGLALAGPFLRIWAGPQYASHSATALRILVAGGWFAAISAVPAAQLLAADRATSVLRTLAWQLVPYLALTAWLTSTWGANGAATAFAVRAAGEAALLFLLVRRRLAR